MNCFHAFILSFILTLIMTPCAIKLAYKINFLEYPKENSIHAKPIPMLGGVVLFSVFFGASFIFGYTHTVMPLFLGSLPIFIGGIYDDLKGLKASQKLLLQFISSIVFISYGIVIQKINMPMIASVELGNFSIPLTILWFLFITNLINIIDGLDGLASGLSTIVFLVLFIVAGLPSNALGVQLLIILGATLAFLVFNFYPAKIFLGNNGSSFLGLAVAYFSIITSQKSTVLPILALPLGILFIQVLDIAYSISRRIKNGISIFKGDKEHIHHIGLYRLKNHRLVVLSFYLVALFLAVILLKSLMF